MLMSMKKAAKSLVKLDPAQRSESVDEFERGMSSLIVGQPDAVQCFVNVYQKFCAGMLAVNRPIAVVLFAGSTGLGKTRTFEAAAQTLLGSPGAITKIDCGEFQHSHEIAKLVGSPPGYLGHRETPPILTQEAIDRFQTKDIHLNFVLFDEIEKANDSVRQLMLGIMDKAVLTLGDSRRVHFNETVVGMTTNLGSAEMDKMLKGAAIGYAKTTPSTGLAAAATNAIAKEFSPEFMNRIDETVMFRQLDANHYREIVNIELRIIQERVLSSLKTVPFRMHVCPDVVDHLVQVGISPRYGARELKRAIERLIVLPLSSLVATGQIKPADLVTIDCDDMGTIQFFREPAPKDLV